MIRYTFQLKDYRTILKGFAKKFHLKIVRKKLVFPPHIGDGYIYASNISPDISFVILNFSLKHDLALIREKTENYGLALAFLQIDISEYLKIREPAGTLQANAPRINNIYLASTNCQMEFSVSRQSRVKMVVVLFSPNFVRKCIKKDILLDLQLYTEQGPRNLYREPITFEYRQYLEDILHTDTDAPVSNLVLHNRVLMLTEKFLTSFLEKESDKGRLKSKKIKEKDMLALQEVEEILSGHELEKFPSIETLSKTAMMSSTKLKKKFKSVYGMKLYEYYNHSRLEKAREMLQTGRYSVKEVGMEIGFSNLSNFAKAFKKEFGVLPNEMLRVS